MVLVNENIKKQIITSLSNILNIKDDNWEKIDINIKIKMIHHYCNFFNSNYILIDNSNSINNINSDIVLDSTTDNEIQDNLSSFNSNNNVKNIDFISIPLKSLKPKKIIQIAGFNKVHNKSLYNDFNNKILNYTFNFRDNFLHKKKQYYLYSNMPKTLYNSILNDYTKIVFDFLNLNINHIKINNFYDELIYNNKDKVIINSNPKCLNIYLSDSKINFEFDNNIKIVCELILYSDKITSNIPVKFRNKLINLF